MSVSLFTVLNRQLQSTKSNKCLLKKYFKPDIVIPLMDQITPTYESTFGICIFTAFQEPQIPVSIGLNAPDPEAYVTYGALFDAVIKDYHKMNQKQEIHHPPSSFGAVTDLECSNLDPDGHIIVAARVHVNRNLSGYRFSNALSPENRVELERKSKDALCSLSEEFQGTYYSVANLSQELRLELAKDHLLFDKDQKLLVINGVYKDWPNSRGMFVSDSKRFVAWVNGEDHLQLITAQSGADIGEVYAQMTRVIQILDEKLPFVKDERLGYLTYCPTNVGTGLHATVHMNLPHLTVRKNFEAVCDRLKLRTKKLRTDETEDGTVTALYAISNKRTAGLTEMESVTEMVAGVQELIRLEQEAAEGKDSTTTTKKCCIS